tara:strand:+ start:104 stop:886 length:783 start_codon:yes stop_codon:yes gene_type:complete
MKNKIRLLKKTMKGGATYPPGFSYEEIVNQAKEHYLSYTTRMNLTEQSVTRYSEAIIEVLNKGYEFGVEYYPNPYEKSLAYFQTTLNNLLFDLGSGDFKSKISGEIQTLINTNGTSFSYLLIDGENVFHKEKDPQVVLEQLRSKKKQIQPSGNLIIYLFCQEHSTRGRFRGLGQYLDQHLTIRVESAANKSEVDDIYLVLTEKIIKYKYLTSPMGHINSYGIGSGYKGREGSPYPISDVSFVRHETPRIVIWTNDNYRWL